MPEYTYLDLFFIDDLIDKNIDLETDVRLSASHENIAEFAHFFK